MLHEAIASGVFYLLATLSVVAAIAVVSTVRILRAAIFLAGVLICGAGFYILLGFEFLAGIQVLVYVGGIVVLMVFAIMLTTSIEIKEVAPTVKRQIMALFASLAFFVVTVSTFLSADFKIKPPTGPIENDAHAIGLLLLDYGPEGYVVPFELISLLLLSAVVGGIVIARKSGIKAKSE